MEKAALRKEEDASSEPVIRKDIMANPDLTRQSPSPPPIIDIAISGLSRSSLDVEDTDNHSAHPSHSQYDIV